MNFGRLIAFLHRPLTFVNEVLTNCGGVMKSRFPRVRPLRYTLAALLIVLCCHLAASAQGIIIPPVTAVRARFRDAGKNLFQASVFPIAPTSEKKIELIYPQALNNDGSTIAAADIIGC